MPALKGVVIKSIVIIWQKTQEYVINARKMFHPIETRLPNTILWPGGMTVKDNRETSGQSFHPALMSG